MLILRNMFGKLFSISEVKWRIDLKKYERRGGQIKITKWQKVMLDFFFCFLINKEKFSKEYNKTFGWFSNKYINAFPTLAVAFSKKKKRQNYPIVKATKEDFLLFFSLFLLHPCFFNPSKSGLGPHWAFRRGNETSSEIKSLRVRESGLLT